MLNLNSLGSCIIGYSRLCVPAIMAAMITFSNPALSQENNLPVTSAQLFIDDIPIMQDMLVETELSISFDSPSGRIIVLFARTDNTNDSVYAYYNDAMRALGWQAYADIFQRNNEQFQIFQANTAKGKLWKLSIIPATLVK